MNSSFNLSFIDFLMSMMVALFALFFVCFMQMNELSKGNVMDKSEFIIEMEWKDGSPNDIDLWMENPIGETVWYNAKDIGLMTLDRDQTGGNQNIRSLETGQEIVDIKRREVANIRSFIPGEYTVNAVYFASGNNEEVAVKIKVRKLNPYVEVYEETKILKFAKDEVTFVRFIVDDKGNVTNIDTTTQVSLLVKNGLQDNGYTPGGMQE